MSMEYGLIGEKLGHSFSKIIHNALCDYDYELLELTQDGLDNFLTKKQFRAVNVTIPYKQTVIPYLDSIDNKARAIGAVNTIVNRDGKLYGYNTDFDGMRLLLQKNSIELAGKRIAILGSGGTSKTAFAVASALGAHTAVRVSRNGTDGCITYEELYEKHKDTEVIINTTPCGMYPNIGTAAVDITRFEKLNAVADAVYNPLRSELVMQARERGITAVGGLYMLVCQAAVAAEHFIGKSIDIQEINRVYNSIIYEKENIVLVGMPGCGKSTIGKSLASKLGRELVDTDTLIVDREGISIPEIFKRNGEKGFRRIESEVISELSKRSGIIIATGGGAVLNPINVRFLKQNGRMVLLNRNIDDIKATKSRPLSSNRDKLLKLYSERMPIYRACADMSVKVTGIASDCADGIIKELLSWM